MFKMFLISSLAVLSLWNSAHSEESQSDIDLSERDRVVDFIRSNMIGRRVETEYNGTIAGGTIDTEFQRLTRFANLRVSDRGLSFDTIVIIRQSNWDLEGDTRVEPPLVKDRELVVRYELTVRRSTGNLVGRQAQIITSNADNSGRGGWCTIDFAEGALTLTSSNGLYSDHYAAGNTHTPGASTSQRIFRVEDDLLISQYSYTTYDVDPETFERTRRGDPINTEEVEKP